MNRTEHLLTILAEECAELAQRASKANRFGLEEVEDGQQLTNADRIILEYGDLFGVLSMLVIDGCLPKVRSCEIDALAEAKMGRVEHWLKYSAERETLTEKP